MKIRFTLKFLFIAITVISGLIAVGVCWWQNASRQRAAIVALAPFASLSYDYQYESADSLNDGNPTLSGSAEIDNWTTDLFHSIVYVDFFKDPPGYGELRRLPNLIHLNLVQITDTDLEVLNFVPKLQVLRFTQSCQGITDAGMAQVDKLHSLKSLSLGSTITDQGLAKLQDLQELRSLNLAACNRITGMALTDLSCGETLEYLALGEGIEDKYLGYVRNFIKLKSLTIVPTKATVHLTDEGLKKLSDHPSLQELRLVAPAITDSSGLVIASLSKLEVLKIIGAKITKLSCLSACRKLRQLNIASNKAIDDTALKGIESLQQLEDLDLTNTSVKGIDLDSLEKLPRLRVLSLRHCPVDDSAIDQIAKLGELRWVNLDHTQMTEGGKERLRLVRPDLQIGVP